MTRIVIFLAIFFSIPWTNQATAEEPPLTILTSWIERNRVGVTYWETESRANKLIRGFTFSTQWFNESGEEITEAGSTLRDKAGNPLPVVIPTPPSLTVFKADGVVPRGAVVPLILRVYDPRHPEVTKSVAKHVVRMKCRLISVDLADGTVWTPPADHPITFEARLKPKDEKAEKTKMK